MTSLSRIFIKPPFQSLRLATASAAALERAKLFPNERYGVNYSTNWSISSLGLSVRDLAFRNASDKTLLNYVLRGSYDKQTNTLSFQSSEAESALFTKPPLDAETFEDISFACKESMSLADVLFMQDGLAAGIPVRFVTNDALYAFYVKRLLIPSPFQANEFTPSAVVLHSKVPDEAASGPYCAVSGNTVISRGQCSPVLLIKAISSAIASKCDGLALPGDICVDKNGEVTVIIGAANTGFSEKYGELMGGLGWIWNKNGVSRLWQSTFTSGKKKSAPSIEYGNHSLTDLGDFPVLGHPKKILIVSATDSAPKGTSIDHSKALEMYNGFGLSKAKQHTDLWAELLKSSATQVILM